MTAARKENIRMTKSKSKSSPKVLNAEPKREMPLVKTSDEMHMLIAQAIDRNVNVETMEKLLAMRREIKAEWARSQYHAALSAFQAECPIIKKTKIVYNKDGKTERYRYAPIDSIITQVRHLLEKHGFNHAEDAKIEGRAVNAWCIITHRDGHSERSGFTVPIDPEAYMNEAQKYAAALTFAKRYAFCDGLGILTGDEDVDAVSIDSSGPSMTRHRRTTPYEEVSGADDPKVQADRADLIAFLSKEKIPDGFLLALLMEKKLIDGHTKMIAQLKPGVLRRCLSDASKANLLKAWKQQQKDDAPKEEQPKAAAAAAKQEVRTREGDQRRESIKRAMTPAGEAFNPTDLLAQDGYENWREVKIHFGDQKGSTLGKLSAKSLLWWIANWKPKPFKGSWNEKDVLLDAALVLASHELAAARGEDE